MSGGIGTRLWPLSREQHPKQFLALTSEYTLFQEAIRRIQSISYLDPPIVVTNERHRFMVRGQLKEAGCDYESIILEPSGRGTAPATLLGALRAKTIDDSCLVLIGTADHIIDDRKGFERAICLAQNIGLNKRIAVFGIKPTRPETGYGYIKMGNQLDEQVFEVSMFVEKPNIEDAEKYVYEDGWLWNSGMFLTDVSNFLEEIKSYQPKMHQICLSAYEKTELDENFLRVNKHDFELVPKDSIDCALMEKTTNGIVVTVDTGWSDVGSWQSLWEVGDKDQNGNVTHGDVISVKTQNTYSHSENGLIATAGVKNLVIVKTKDAVLVMQRDRTEELQKIVSKLEALNRDERIYHKQIYRPWGSYELLDSGKGFLVKRLTVYPKCRLSLQSHKGRSEHWVIVSGEAFITRDSKSFILKKNESTFIPPEMLHRLENMGSEDLVLIEVQTGDHLSEDDIIRYEDDFGRS